MAKRLEIQKSITQLLETITPANDYQHDLTGKVYRGRTAFGETDKVPVVTILERPAFGDSPIFPAENKNLRKDTYERVIQGFAKANVDNPTDNAHLLLDDCKLALSALINQKSPSLKFNRLEGVVSVAISSGNVLPPEPQKSIHHSTFIILLTVEMTDRLNPEMT